MPTYGDTAHRTNLGLLRRFPPWRWDWAAGRDYIECHHRTSLFSSGTTKTRLQDLALICSNCHRMIHRMKTWLLPERLKQIVDERR